MQSGARFAVLGLILILGAAAASAAMPALADPPGGFKHGKAERGDGDEDRRGDDRRDDDRRGDDRHHGRQGDEHRGFQDGDRVAVHDYFAERERQGHCPPGLAKKHNGCMPPGQAKRWEVGAPLPRDVVSYNLPSSLVVQLTPPPVGYRYVRVASDILMIASGTGMVAAAIEDLGR